MVPRENKNNAHAKFEGTNEEYFGIFRNGLIGPVHTKTHRKRINSKAHSKVDKFENAT